MKQYSEGINTTLTDTKVCLKLLEFVLGREAFLVS